MSSYNKFTKNTSSKLGTEIIRGGNLTRIMQEGALNSIPIWELLNITEEQYLQDYEYPAFAANQARIDAEMRALVDASGVSPFVVDQVAIDALNADPVSNNDVSGNE